MLVTQLTGFTAVAVLDVLPGWGVVAVAAAVVLVTRAGVERLRPAARRSVSGGAGR